MLVVESVQEVQQCRGGSTRTLFTFAVEAVRPVLLFLVPVSVLEGEVVVAVR